MTTLRPASRSSAPDARPPAADAVPRTDTFVPWRRAILPAVVAMGLAGTAGLVMRITDGHLPAGYGSYVPWGLWIAIYFVGVGIAAGAFGIAALGYLLAAPGFRSRTSLRVAAVLVAATVAPALLAVGLDLGHMERAWRIVLTPSFTSMMAFNTWTYIALLTVAAVVWWLSYRPDRGWLRPVLVLATVVSLMVPSQSGAFFGVVDAKPYWHSALLPVLLLVSGVVAGAGTLMVARAVIGDRPLGGVVDSRENTRSALQVLRKVLLLGLAVYFVLEFAEYSIALWNPQATAPEVSLVLTGPYWWVFWVVHVVLGGIVPVVLLLSRRPAAWVVAGLLVAVTSVSTRLNILVPGQSTSEIEGLQEAFFHPRLDHVYNATLMEYLVALFCVALGVAIFYAGLRISSAVQHRTTRKDTTDVSA